jgi:nitrite reductase/ring-hydroxylating ferredoxin subunit
VSPALAFLGLTILGTWGLAAIGLIAGGIILMFFPGDAATNSDHMLGGVVLLVLGLANMGLVQIVSQPLLGLDPPLPIKAKSIIPHARMKKWHSVGQLRDYVDGLPKEVRARTQRVLIVRQGDTAYALNGLCSHARLPLGGLPGSPIKPYAIRDGCVMCPFHGARYEVATGRVVRQPFDSQFNNEHPLLGRLQSKIFFFNKKAEDTQTYPVRIENGEIIVGLPK